MALYFLRIAKIGGAIIAPGEEQAEMGGFRAP